MLRLLKGDGGSAGYILSPFCSALILLLQGQDRGGSGVRGADRGIGKKRGGGERDGEEEGDVERVSYRGGCVEEGGRLECVGRSASTTKIIGKQWKKPSHAVPKAMSANHLGSLTDFVKGVKRLSLLLTSSGEVLAQRYSL